MDELYTIEGLKKDGLTHWGLKGMKWGVRRYQNPDGTRTPEGKKRYSKVSIPMTKAEQRQVKLVKKISSNKKFMDSQEKKLKKYAEKAKKQQDNKLLKKEQERQRKIADKYASNKKFVSKQEEKMIKYASKYLKKRLKDVDLNQYDKETREAIKAVMNQDVEKARKYMKPASDDFMSQMNDTARRHNQWAMEQSRRAAHNAAMQSIHAANSMHPGF